MKFVLIAAAVGVLLGGIAVGAPAAAESPAALCILDNPEC